MTRQVMQRGGQGGRRVRAAGAQRTLNLGHAQEAETGGHEQRRPVNQAIWFRYRHFNPSGVLTGKGEIYSHSGFP
jgi:hypothetical protein